MTTDPHLKNQYHIISKHGIGDVWFDTISHHRSLHAAAAFKPGDIIINFSAGTIQEYPTYLTVQTGDNTHITLEPAFLQYINHSCDPNVFFDTTTLQLICLRPIQLNEEFRFFYPSTEWEMAQPFVCNCGSANCLQLIKGAAHLSSETLSKYRLTDFISQKKRFVNHVIL